MPFNAVVIAPTYNNSTTVVDILRRVQAINLPLIVIDDGCTDNTADLLQEWTRDMSDPSDVIVCHHETNRGKAEALRTGFREARARGYTHVVSIDTDGQHYPEDIPKLVDIARGNVDALVLGIRSEHIEGYPMRSMVGRRFSNFFTRLACGLIVKDSVCGLRVYPLSIVETIHCGAQLYGYESEIIVRAGWAKCPVSQLEITSHYLPPGQRVSHFRPCWDTVRCLWLYLKLMVIAILPFTRTRGAGAQDKGLRNNSPMWVRLLAWLSPKELLAELRRGDIGRLSVAAGASLGAFIANLPIYPFQTLVSLYVAKKLHFHPLAVLAGSAISTPPVGPVLVVTAVVVGHLLLYGTIPDLAGIKEIPVAELFVMMLLEWTLGALIVGVGCMVVVFLGTLGLLTFISGRSVNQAESAESH